MAGTVESSSYLSVNSLAMHFAIRRGILQRSVGSVRAVDGVNLNVVERKTLALVGESGSGKTTVGRAIARLYKPTGGRIVLNGQDITNLEGAALRQVRRHVQMVFQDPYSSLNPKMRISETIEEPLIVHSMGDSRERRYRVGNLLERVGLSSSVARRFPRSLSGGQRQRVAIARALAINPSLVICDEPVSALDVSIQAQVLNLLVDLQGESGLTYLFIAHDLAVVRHISDRVAVMYLGKIMEESATDRLFRQPLHPYSAALLSAVPEPNPDRERRRDRILLTGDIPSPRNPPGGCRFHTRCWLRAELGNPDICSAEEPPLAPVESGRYSACHFARETARRPL